MRKRVDTYGYRKDTHIRYTQTNKERDGNKKTRDANDCDSDRDREFDPDRHRWQLKNRDSER